MLALSETNNQRKNLINNVSQETTMRTKTLLVTLILTVLLILLVGCETPTPNAQSCANICDEQITEALLNNQNNNQNAAETPQPGTGCPFNTCFEGNYVSENYITTKTIATGLSDKICNQALEEQLNITENYLCFIKEATQLSNAGRDGQGNQLWQWRIDCGCSYQID